MKKRPVAEIRAGLKIRCLEALVEGLKGHTLVIPAGEKKRYKVKMGKIADFMVKEMWRNK